MSSEPVESLSLEQRIKIQTHKKKPGIGSRDKNSAPQRFKKRANKNRPREASSKIPVKSPRFPKPQNKFIDPRFDRLYGEFSETEFKSNYGFVDEIKKKELVKLKKMSKKEKNEDRRQEIREVLRREADRERELKKVRALREKVAAEKTQIAEAIAEGKSVRFKTKAESKLSELVHKFGALKEKGKLGKYMKKKNKSDRWA